MSIKKKIIVKGPLLTASGYGVHSRQVLKALLSRKDVDVYVRPTEWGITSWILDTKREDGFIQKIVELSRKPIKNILFDESYQIDIPDAWEKIAQKNIGVTAGFEADVVKKSWINLVNKMDKVIVPSEFSKSAFLKTSKLSNIDLKTEIFVINEWYYSLFDNEKVDLDYFDSLKYDQNILIIGQVTAQNTTADRKNIFKTIRCAIDFVKDKEDIGIVLKINGGKNSKKSDNMLKSVLKEIIDKKYHNKVNLITGNLSVSELKNLYCSKKISCMLSGTRAEGWGLPFVESAACGLPIIATNYSAYKEFLGDDFSQVDYELIKFKSDQRFVDFDSDSYWAEFDSKSMQFCLEDFFNNKTNLINKAKNRQKIIKQTYNQNYILDNYKLFFKKIN